MAYPIVMLTQFLWNRNGDVNQHQATKSPGIYLGIQQFMEQNRVWADWSDAESVIYSLRNYFPKQPISIGRICAVSGKNIYNFVIVHSLKY